MGEDAVLFHFAHAHTAVGLPSFNGLSGDGVFGSVVYDVLSGDSEFLESLVESGAKEDIGDHLFSGGSIAHRHISLI